MTEFHPNPINWTKCNQQGHTIACIDGDKIRSFSINLPKLNKKEISQAIPHIIAKDLITPVDCMHIAHSPPASDGNIIAWCISKSHYDHIVTELKDDNIFQAIPDYLALPFYENSWTIVAFDEYVAVRTGLLTGYSQRHNLIIPTLKKEYSAKPPKCIHFISSSHQTLNEMKSWAKKHNIKSSTESCDIPYASHIPSTINLLKKKDRPRSQFKHYLSAILTVIFSLIFFLITLITSHSIEASLFQSANRDLKQKIATYKATHLPTVMQQLSLSQIQERINMILNRQHSTFNILMRALGHVISTHQTLQLHSLLYKKNQLQATIHAPTTTQIKPILATLPSGVLKREAVIRNQQGLTLTIILGAKS